METSPRHIKLLLSHTSFAYYYLPTIFSSHMTYDIMVVFAEVAKLLLRNESILLHFKDIF